MPSDMTGGTTAAATTGRGKIRWTVIALLFVITTINYMDRNLLGVLKPTIQGDLHFNESEFGNIVFAFSMAYAVGYASMGWFTGKVGVRIGLAVAAMIWCAASTAHGLVASVGGFMVARVLGTVDGLKRFVQTQESSFHGLNFCQGTVAEALDDPDGRSTT